MERTVEAEAGPVPLGPDDAGAPTLEAGELQPHAGARLAMAGDLDAAAVHREIDDRNRRGRAIVFGQARADADRVAQEAPPVLGGGTFEQGGDAHAGPPFERNATGPSLRRKR
jgi:hypothetical protein